MRDILSNPFLPVIAKINQSPKIFWKEFIQAFLVGIIVLFSGVFIPVFAVLLARSCFF